jgi:hypothetical protein
VEYHVAVNTNGNNNNNTRVDVARLVDWINTGLLADLLRLFLMILLV